MFDGAINMVGGFGTVVSMPSSLLEAVCRKGVKNFTTVSNAGGFGADIWKMMEDISLEKVKESPMLWEPIRYLVSIQK